MGKIAIGASRGQSVRVGSPSSVIKILWQLFKQAGWAPFLVVVLHRIVMLCGWRKYVVFDWILHFTGGLAIAYFLFYLIPYFEARIGKLTRAARLALTYTSACTVAAFWELAEFAASFSRGTVLQHSLSETMVDLLNGVVGAAITVVVLAISGRGREERG